jgi:hypothetical protein
MKRNSKLSKTKLKNLKELMNVIPEEYHSFYNAIKADT